jgi:ribosomal protein S8E
MRGLLSWRLALKSTNKYNVGQFVRWYEAYADGFLGRDAGFGVITEVRHHHVYGDHITYGVLRNKHGDVMWFEEGHVEPERDFKGRMNEQKADDSICS